MINKIFRRIKFLITKKIFQSYFNKIEYNRVIRNFKSYNDNYKSSDHYNMTSVQDQNKCYFDLLSQYCVTNGKICDELQNILSLRKPLPRRNYIESSFFKEIQINELDVIVSNLNEKGYYVFDKLLDGGICDSLVKISQNMPFTTSVDNIKGDKINFNDIKGEVCNFDSNYILGIDVIRKLLCDDIFIAVSEKYFNSEVIFDFPAMWWSFPFEKRDKMDSAQYFHFDFDRIKWLKIFIYLVDVDENNGPHCYIEKSHITGSKPEEFLKRGYVRISDNEILTYYGENDIKHITGKKGTIIFGDTKCWHKGNPLINGHRLLLEFQYTSSLYGAFIKGANFKKEGIDNFDKILDLNPCFFDNLSVV